MQNQPEIIRNADGSINTAHYMALGRQLRSEEAHRQMQAVAQAHRSTFATVRAWFSARIATA